MKLPDSHLFHAASLRLTTVYVAIIMLLSVTFSIWVYNVSIGEISANARNIPASIERLLSRQSPQFLDELTEVQELAIDKARRDVRQQLILLNVIIFASGSTASYILARKSLLPIERSLDAQRRFTADASHELRTPIAAMRLENELALSDDALSIKDAKAQLSSTIEELDKLTELTEGLLQLARLDETKLEKTTVSTHDTAQHAIERVHTQAKKKQIEIKMSIPQQLELCASGPFVEEALVILLDNAIKYSPKKSQVFIAANKTRRGVDITIRDKGLGINSDDMPYIFDRFYRADASRNTNGYGIGLSIAKAIAEAHGGCVSVDKTSASGTTMLLSLPNLR